ncbi:CDP-diacylglycerol--serine O-phosphatidyltransferase [bacterium]|nr:CDP-diacylglycerol--serine O-phosphatidyltransferase [bacterium]MBU1983397.1 CDP-diacylglycerol--serine O-phosphatidyltransferase [bacterium]
MKNRIADGLTSANAFCGLLSILLATTGRPDLAAWLIILAAVFDAFDGKAARFFGSGSRFGVYFDSLADMMSFGVAPAVLIYTTALSSLEFWGVLIAFISALFAAIRLARFTASAPVGEHDFIGLSAPLHGCLLASFVIMNLFLWGGVGDVFVLTLLVIVTSVLMISRFPMPGLPRLSLREPGHNLAKLIFLFAALIAMAVSPRLLTFPVFVVIALVGFIAGAVRIARARSFSRRPEESGVESATTSRGQR